MSDARSVRVVLARRPGGLPAPTDFRVEPQAPLGSPAKGQVQVRVLELALDPYLRSAIAGRHLDSPTVNVGDVVPGRAVAEVISGDRRHRPGDLVVAEAGWQEYANVESSAAEPVRLPSGVSPSAALGILGMPGLTAFAAVSRMMKLSLGDTVVVSAATGAVGGTAGQLAGLLGCRAVAIVGGPDKARLATEVLGFDAAVDRLEPRWRDDLRRACPAGIDAYLDNAGGEVLEGVVEQLAVGARLVLCGLFAQYNGGAPANVPAAAVIARRLDVRGIVVYDHQDLMPRLLERLGPLVADGRVRALEDRRSGLRSAPEAFCDLMAGRTRGKVVVEVAKAQLGLDTPAVTP